MKIAPFTKTYDQVNVLDFPGMELQWQVWQQEQG